MNKIIVMRLDKFIANNTFYSRKEVNKIIRKKMVLVNDKIIIDAAYKVDVLNDIVKINDLVISNKEFIYLALNKPKDYICSNSDKEGQSVLNLIEANNWKNLHIIGRLDKDTTGLVLITNDGQFTHKIKNNKYHVEKEYEVVLEKEFTKEMFEELQKDIVLDGKKLKPFQIININRNKLNIILTEGKYHQIKRLFAIVKNSVIDLKRIRVGKINLYDLNLDEGEYLEIDPIKYEMK